MRVLLQTFGCRANAYDSEAVRAMVERAGHEIVDDATSADVAVFNSCAVTAAAEVDLRKAVRRAARRNPALRTTIMGCASALPDRPGDLSLAALPTVSTLVAGADLAAVAESIGLVPEPAARTSIQTGTRAVLRIQDGCDEHCTFCATTIARGPNRSRNGGEIVDEARRLAERHAEIVITGVHIGTYGADIGTSLGHLMERLVVSVPAARFRLTSVEATEVDDRLIELWAGAPRGLAPSLHAPLQSGSGAVLKRMGRNWYTARTYAAAVERIVSRIPRFGLGADVITGFPGERDADHRATVALVSELPFSYLHVFPYSVRPGTAAERLPDRVSSSVASSRSAELREIGRAKAEAYAIGRDGSDADVVVLGGDPVAREGMTEDYLTVRVSGGPPRGARLAARLSWGGQGLQATAVADDVS
jgi:threonylcarbamoyladenosine tRNA methylthiotransferase MtaB